MSAIAHGWHPDQGSVAKIPLKVAKDFHAADAGHKYGKGMDKVKRITKLARKKLARGGEADLKDDEDKRIRYRDDPIEEVPWDQGNFMSRWGSRAMPAMFAPQYPALQDSLQQKARDMRGYADGGDVGGTADDMIMAARNRLSDQPSRMPAPDRETDPFREAEHRRFSINADPRVDTNISDEDLDRAANVAMSAGPGIMVGPYGAHMLRQAAREAGQAATPHPVYGQAVEEAASKLRPEFRDAYKGWQVDARDAQGRGTLEMRQANNNPYDTDVWRHSGWFRGAEGMPRKEIPDIGTKLAPLYEGAEKYSIEHPAGDIHKVYDLPPVSFNRGLDKTSAQIWPDTSRIELGGKPSDKGTVSRALHEMQHAIQKKEGFAGGSNPTNPNLKGAEEELFHGEPIPDWQKEIIMSDPRHKGLNMENVPPVTAGRYVAYRRHAGEVEAENVQDRRAKSFRYLSHPEDTEKIPRGVQVIDDRHMPREYYAGGGRFNFDPERAAAYGLARQGMLHSSVPGRTDKLNLNVPSGSYIIPADIPSAIGQGNSMAGGSILNKMFAKGPYGMNIGKAKGPRVHNRAASLSKIRFAEGGEAETEHAPIVAAGGEFVVHPDTVAELGHGDLDLGHSILDAFVKHIREKNIATLRSLKPPKGSSDAKGK